MVIINNLLKSYLIKLFNLIYPKHIKCIFCGNEITNPNKYDMCDNCLTHLPFIVKDFCSRCGSQLSQNHIGVCQNCKITNFHFDYARAVFVYDKNVKRTIKKLKFSSAKYLIEPLANCLYYKFTSLNWKVDLVTFVPIHESRLKLRGYNQSEELAKEFSKLTNIENINCFTKIKNTPNQTSLSRKDRQNNLIDAFKLKYKSVKDKNILIIDDIFTTGATTNELSKLLKNNGANKVYVLTIAHTKERPNNL